MWLTYLKKPHNRKYEGRTIAEVAEMMGKDEVDAMCDLLLDEDLQTSYVALDQTAPHFPTSSSILSRWWAPTACFSGLPQPAHLRHLPADTLGVRAGGEIHVSGERGTQDDFLPCPAPGYT